ncbi:unnamed protein product [Adineta ricciae]|uniref:ATP-binding cassette sub-family B member 6 N-terminal five TM domain-containing protein n=1 Tax=Adineta ricciae TaxID=249248 RepID=A0A814R6N8_ADIRI|nr:unnamed protein product [Adineta ricciae]
MYIHLQLLYGKSGRDVLIYPFLLGSASTVVIMLYRMSQEAERTRLTTPDINQQRFNVDLSIQIKLSESLTTSNFVNMSSVDSEDNAANKLLETWRSLSPSLDRVNKFSYDVMLSKYVESSAWNGIQLLDGQNNTELLKIDRLSTNELISFSSLMKSGTVDGKFVYYVNYGRQEDFAYIFKHRIGIREPEKSVVFMRRRPSVISQTEQIYQAIYYGFGGLVLFDDNVDQQIVTNNRHTFFEEWRRYLAMQDRDDYLNGRLKNTNHSICVLTLSYDDVQRIFGSLQPDSNQWSTPPLEWHNQSTLMKIGGPLTTIKLRLVVNVEQVKVELPVVMILIQYIFYKRFGFKIEREYIDASVLYSIQIVLTVLLACEPILLYATETTAFGKSKLPGYTIFRCVLRTAVWLFSLIILRIERTKTMPTSQTRGHGLTLLTFWCIAVLIELCTLISYRSSCKSG